MAEMITRCPKCDTAFRITPGHLHSARGSVRCGSCLQVFNARENLTEASLTALAESAPDPAPVTPQATKKATQKKQPQPASPPPELQIPDSDDVLISDDMDTEDDFSKPRSSLPQSSLFERVIDDNRDQDESATEDESWALKLLDDNDPTPIDNLRRAKPTERKKPVESFARMEEDSKSSGYDQEPGEKQDWYENAVDTESDDYLFESSLLPADRRDSAGSAYLDAIEPEPVEFAVRQDRRFWRSRLLWTSLCVLALLFLLGQIAWLQYPVLNRIEPYRSFYSTACDLLGCQLPPQEDLGAIQASNLVVRSHPQADKALMVDVVLQNTAPYQQPFPALELTFSNLQSEVVARRRFSPDEYLGGELAGEDMMPVSQPVHIALEIVDPGTEAVNYRIEAVASES